MNTYFFTLAFLLMMSFFTSSEVSRMAQNTLEKGCYSSSCEATIAAEELRELSHLEALRDRENPTPEERRKKVNTLNKADSSVPKARALGVNAARPPNNSRLNLYTLIQNQENLFKGFSLYEVAAALISNLYKTELFADFAGLEYVILDKILERTKEGIQSLDQLSTLDFEDRRVQEIYTQMLQGTKNIPSFFNYLTYDPNVGMKQARKINLLFADPQLIYAIFPKKSCAEKVLSYREKIWNDIEYQEENRLELHQTECKKRGEYSKQLKSELDAILAAEGLNGKNYRKHVFDCTLGKPGNLIFFKDPKTGQTLRKSYAPPRHLTS